MTDADDKYIYRYNKPCVTVAKQLRALGVECFINDSSKIIYNKENDSINTPNNTTTKKVNKLTHNDIFFG
jgi:hypothetical protein